MTISYDWSDEDSVSDNEEVAVERKAQAPAWTETAQEKVWIGFLLASGLAGLGAYPLVSLGTFVASMIFLATNDLRRELRLLRQRT